MCSCVDYGQYGAQYLSLKIKTGMHAKGFCGGMPSMHPDALPAQHGNTPQTPMSCFAHLNSPSSRTPLYERLVSAAVTNRGSF